MVIMIKEIFKKKVNSTKILLFFCFGITFSACYYAFLIQDYYETYIPQLIEANDRKELEIIQLKENLIEKSNISTEVDIKENTSRGKLFWGVVVGLLVVGGVAVIYCLSGSSFDFFGGFGFTKDDNVSINELTIVNENFQYLKEETLKTREICAQLNKDVKEN